MNPGGNILESSLLLANGGCYLSDHRPFLVEQL
jgi:hypothetical protein